MDNQGQLWEKPRNHTTNYWDQIQSIQNRSTSSNISPPDPLPISPGNDSPHKNNGEPENGWDVYRMTAVYSENFESGAGCRLFSHSSNGSSVVRELIRNKNEEDWSRGATFDAYPNFHSSATIDESTRILRLFYSTGGRALQYITKKNAKYEKGARQLRVLPTLGPSLENYLIHSSADIAAISDTYVYHYSGPPPKNRELDITAPAPNKGITIQSFMTNDDRLPDIIISPPGFPTFIGWASHQEILDGSPVFTC